MNGQVYTIQGLRWEVISTFQRRGVEWAKMKCLDKRRKQRSVTVEFLKLIAPFRRVS
ncbi:hypothetical protein POF51_22280 [Brevibacillus sp. AG]|uniref:hypothetical protein n=1 Tax=Brevibacillus sp. AG TaxID=3020891 RepID=UPI00232F6770|nr:hypothetical protein [Brevibacillus sp. AG]MDC0763456.1 hypothetical protein [Brevibacillus sp. AG]